MMSYKQFSYSDGGEHYYLIDNGCVYGLSDSIRASKFPMEAGSTSLVMGGKGKNTDRLAMCESTSGEDNFLSGILVRFDLTLTVKAWIEFERYHFAQIVSSQSTMHRLKDMDLRTTFSAYVDPFMVQIMQDLQKRYAESKDPDDYLRLLYSCPAGLRLTAQVVTNYRQLKTIYKQRRNHRLPEWRAFCRWIETLPESEWLTTHGR